MTAIPQRIPTLHPQVEKALRECARSFSTKGITLFIFGSLARKNPHQGADLDLGYFWKSKPSETVKIQLEHAIDALPTIRSIDLVDFSTVSEPFKHEALKHIIKLI